MQRAGHHVVRGAVVTALSALLLVLGGPFAGAQAHVPARTTGPGVHRTAGVDPGPGTVPQAHRSSHLQRPDGSAPALVPDRSGAPRPTYATRAGSAHTEPVRATTRATVHGRAPPA
jgi:hypothetical protein